MEQEKIFSGKVISSLEKILPYVEPTAEETKGSVLAGQTYNLQLAFRLEQPDVHENSVRVQGELAEYSEVFTQELVPAYTYAWNIDEYYIGKEHTLVPDPLKPFTCVGASLPARQWRGVWVSFHIPKTAKAGEYQTTFELVDKASGEVLATLTHTLEVIAVNVPENDLKNTNWMHYDCICEKHGVKPFTPKFYKVFESYLKRYVEMGFTMLLTPLFTPPLDTVVGGERLTAQLIEVERNQGEYSFSFQKLKRFLSFVFARGIKYIEFSHLFTQWGGKATPKIIAKVDGEEKRIFGWDVASNDEEYKKFLTAFLPALVAFIKDLGIENRCYFHLTDEPQADHLPAYELCRKLVKGLVGDLPIMDALSHGEYYDKGLVDVPVSVLNHYPEFAERKVKPLFVYNCCGPANEYYSNRFINMTGERTRVLGVQMYLTDVQGYLHWGYNFYNHRLSLKPIDPFTTTDAGGAFSSGDGFIVYPAPDGAYTSIRAKLVREGFDDYDALKLLESYIGREKTVEIVKKWGFDGYTVYPRSPKTLFEFRQEINRLIKEYSKNA